MAPSFFKVLIDPSAPQLKLPSAFVNRHLKNKIPSNPTLRSATGGYSWPLKVKKIGDSYCFAQGWENVVEDVELSFGDFLVFCLVSKNTFKVRIFAPNGCEKDLPKRVQVEDDIGSVGDETNGVVGDDVDVSVDIDEEEEEEEEEEEDDEDEDDEDDDAVDVDNDSDGDAADEADDADNGDIDGNDGDPFFMTTISRTHLNLLPLPKEFVGLAGIGAEKTVILKNIGDEEWLMSLRWDKYRYWLSSGWRDFSRRNELSIGDECIFKFIRSEGKLSLAKVRKKARAPPPKIEATQVERKKRGRPPRRRTDVISDDDCVEVVQRPRGTPPVVKEKCSVVYF